jgi:hypothetical protein
MEIPGDALGEYKNIHKKLTGGDLTDAEASAMAQNLFRLFIAVYESVPAEWLEELEGTPADQSQSISPIDDIQLPAVS